MQAPKLIVKLGLLFFKYFLQLMCIWCARHFALANYPKNVNYTESNFPWKKLCINSAVAFPGELRILEGKTPETRR
jgi:hypothetical protein